MQHLTKITIDPAQFEYITLGKYKPGVLTKEQYNNLKDKSGWIKAYTPSNKICYINPKNQAFNRRKEYVEKTPQHYYKLIDFVKSNQNTEFAGNIYAQIIFIFCTKVLEIRGDKYSLSYIVYNYHLDKLKEYLNQ